MMRTLFALALLTATTAFGQTAPRLNHLALYVHRLDTSIAFYENLLQLRRVADPFNDGKHAWYDLGEKAKLHLIEGAPANIPRDKNDHLCFSVPSVDNFVQRLKNLRVAYSDWPGKPNAVTTRVDGVKQVYFQDPDGHWIEINDAKD